MKPAYERIVNACERLDKFADHCVFWLAANFFNGQNFDSSCTAVPLLQSLGNVQCVICFRDQHLVIGLCIGELQLQLVFIVLMELQIAHEQHSALRVPVYPSDRLCND